MYVCVCACMYVCVLWLPMRLCFDTYVFMYVKTVFMHVQTAELVALCMLLSRGTHACTDVYHMHACVHNTGNMGACYEH